MGGGGQAVLPPTDLAVRSRSRRDQMTPLKRGAVFGEIAARKTAQHTVKYRDGGVGSEVANHLFPGQRS